MLRTHCQTSGVSLTEQDPYNNVVRTTDRGDGGGARRHPEPPHQLLRRGPRPAHRLLAPASPATPSSIIQEETGIPKVVDPLGGSYYVEALTQALADRAWTIIEEVEALGGMTKAVDSGMPKLRIEEAAARRQARVDRGEEVIVGVNKYRSDDPDHVDVLDIDNTKVREQQVARLEQIRATRDAAACDAALDRPARGRRRRRQPPRPLHRRGPGAGHRRRDERRHGGGVRPPQGGDP